MIKKIILENYMSHARTEIELAKGLTVLIGPNNCGKSAVVGALQTLCHNEKGSFMVRAGEKKCRVTVETEDGHIIVWRRQKDVPSYEIDGEEFHRIGNSPPENLQKFLRLPKVQSEQGGNVEFDIHFGNQKTPIFLVDEPPGRAATFFASSSDARLLVEMQRIHRQKIQEAKQIAKKTKDDVAALEKKLKCLSPLDAVGSLLGKLQDSETQIEKAGREIDQLSKLIAILEKEEKALLNQSRNWEALSVLAAPPEMEPAVSLEELADSISEHLGSLNMKIVQLACLGGLAQLAVKLPELVLEHEERWTAEGCFQKLAGLIVDLSSTLEEREKKIKEFSCLGQLVPVPELSPAEMLDGLISRLLFEMKKMEHFSVKNIFLENLREVPKLLPEAEISLLLREFIALEALLTEHQAKSLVLANLGQPPEPFVVKPLKELIEKISDTDRQFQIMKRSLDTLTILEPPPEFLEPREIFETIATIQAELKQVKEFETSFVELVAEEKEVVQELRIWIKDHPNCPTCGGVLTVAHTDALLSKENPGDD